MMKKLSEKINGRFVILALVILGIFIVVILPITSSLLAQKTNSALIPDTMIFYSPTMFYNLANIYGEQGIFAYVVSKYTLDIIWPLAYLFSLCVLLMHLYQITKRFAWSLSFPMIAFVLDMIENSLLVVLFLNHPKQINWLVYFASGFTLMKWFIIATCLVVMLMQLGKTRIIRMQKKEDIPND